MAADCEVLIRIKKRRNGIKVNFIRRRLGLRIGLKFMLEMQRKKEVG